MTITIAIFILSLFSVSFLLGTKMYQLKTQSHPLPERFRRQVKDVALHIENQASRMVQYVNRKTLKQLVSVVWQKGSRLAGKLFEYLKEVYARAARTRRDLSGENKSSAYLSEVLRHKHENGSSEGERLQ